MVSFFALVALASIPATLAQQLTINTPQGVVQCQPIQLGWSGGTPPYFLSFIPAGQASGAAIKQFPTQNSNAFTWKADLPSGSTFTISLRDSIGATAFSDIVTIQSGPDSSCINTSITEGSGGSATPTSGGSPSGPAPAATTGAPSTGPSAGSPASSGSARPTSSGAATSPTPSNAASNIKRSALAMAGVMGLVGAVLF